VKLFKIAFFCAAVAIVAIISGGTAKASGFQLNEASITSQSRSFAGVGVANDDLSAAFFNPAGISLVKERGLQGSVTHVGIKTEFSGKFNFSPPFGAHNAEGSAGGTAEGKISSFVPAVFFVTPVNDKINLSLSLTVPFGLGTSYGEESFVRHFAVDSNLRMLQIDAAFSYKVTDRFAVGLGVGLQEASAKLSSIKPSDGNLSEINGSDYRAAFNLGAMYSFSDNHRVGAAFRPSVNHNLDGAVKSGVDILAELRTPEVLTFSSFHKLNDKLALSSTVKWTNWERFEYLTILDDSDGSTNGNILSQVQENWKGAWMFALGADYAFHKEWILRGGVAYEQTPIAGEKHLTPRIPDANRVLLSLGASYAPAGNWQIDLGFTSFLISNADINHTQNIYNNGVAVSDQTITGKFSSKGLANLIGLGIQYKF
jgi:long-chain fatty acid transport protein